MNRKELILQSALHLFAEQGVKSTSTKRVAEEAGVSEGLIFRHYESKEGLLKAILDLGMDHAMTLYSHVFKQKDPLARIHLALEIPFFVSEADKPFWKLIYSLKWKESVYDDRISAPLLHSLKEAFKELGYRCPEAEAENVMCWLDGMAMNILLKPGTDHYPLLDVMKARYDR